MQATHEIKGLKVSTVRIVPCGYSWHIVDGITGELIDMYASHKTCVVICEQNGWSVAKEEVLQ